MLRSGEQGTDAARRSLANLASTGATHIRLEVVWYQANVSATEIQPDTTPGSPLRSSDDAALAASIAAASALGLNVTLAPLVDLDWDDPAVNKPDGAGSIDGSGLNRWTPNPKAVSRALIGRGTLGSGGMREAEWVAWFASYMAFVIHYAAFAEQHGIKLFDIATDLQAAAVLPANTPRWLALIEAVRKVYSGKLMLTTGSLTSTVSSAVWAAVDVIGVDVANVSLAAAPWTHLPAGESQFSWTVADERLNVTVAMVQAAWTGAGGAISELAALHTRTGGNKPIILTAGYQSRPNCIVRPAGQPRLDCSQDCSCWTMCVEMDCQAAAYSGLLEASSSESWFGGVFFHGWSADPTAGGTSDAHYTPWAKPAEAVLRKAFAHDEQIAAGVVAEVLPRKPVGSSTRELARELRAANAARVTEQQEAASITVTGANPPLKTVRHCLCLVCVSTACAR